MLGRDVFARTLYGGRISLLIGVTAALTTLAAGTLVGLLAGFSRWIDAIVMRIMDGVMAIPDILLAIALTTVARGGIVTVVVAITVTQLPYVARLIRGLVLTLREQTFVEAAVAVGTTPHAILRRHILPNTVSALVVQGTYILALAILIEAYLSFLGAGTPPETPSWGNIVAEGRSYVRIALWIVAFPGLFLTLTVLAINLLGDGLRDLLDPRFVPESR
jgi:peptide/nickel transport system permease protein